MIALRGRCNPVYKRSGSITIHSHLRSSPHCFLSFLSQCYMCNSTSSILLWTLSERYEEHSSLNRVPSGTLPTQNSKIYLFFVFFTRLQAAKAPQKSKCWGVGVGGNQAMCATPKVCKRRNIPKIIIPLLILPAIL